MLTIARFQLTPMTFHRYAREVTRYSQMCVSTNKIFGMQSPSPLCKYFTWIDHEVPEDVQKDQYQDCLRRQRWFEEAWRKSVVKRRGWSGRNERKRGHAKRNLLMRRTRQESLQRLARRKRRMRHMTRRGNGLARLSRDFASVHSSWTRARSHLSSTIF